MKIKNRIECPKCGSNDTRYKTIQKNGKYKIFCKSCHRFSNVEYDEESIVNVEDSENIEFPEFLDKKIGETIDWREWVKVLKTQQNLHQRQSFSQDEATIKLPNIDNRAIIVFSADWHLGSLSCSYSEFQKNMELILNTPHVYLITVGDLVDSFRNFSSLQPVLSQIANPRDQVLILRSILNEFWAKKKWLCATWGNHDIERDEKLYGQSIVKDELNKHLVYFNGKGTLTLLVGKQKYIIRMSHSFPGNSIYNQLHSAMREMRFQYPDADIFVSGHKHQPAVAYSYEYGQRKCFIRTGSFETDSGYSKRFYAKGIIGVPAVILRSDIHSVTAFPSLEELLELEK